MAAFTALYVELAAKRKTRDDMNTSDQARAEKIELLSFAVEEIRGSSLTPAEEDSLSDEEQRLSQHEKLYALIDQTADGLSEADGVVPALKRLRGALENAASIDSSLSAQLSRVENSFYELEDVSASLRQYRDALLFDPARLEQIEERLSVIYKLKKKYGATVADVLSFAADAEKQLEQLSQWETNRSLIDGEIVALEKRVYAAGQAISEKRNKSARTLESGVEEILRSLGMAGTSFRVQIELRDGTDTMQRSGPYGFDTIEFMISANPGEPLKPLARIASGGELSRVCSP